MPAGLFVCIDVPDLERGIAFYTQAGLGLHLIRRIGDGFAEIGGAPATIHLLVQPAGSTPSPRASQRRTYARHWTPVHLDFVVSDLEGAVASATAAGATLERPIESAAWGRMANLADPFGHGVCLITLGPRGYDALLDDAS